MLYVVATPIGNLEDITLRALRILKEVDVILAEDKRRTGKLLKRYNIKNIQQIYNDHNKERRTKNIIQMLKKGKDIALASDSGTPGINDPGFYLIRACIKEDIKVSPVPGPNAAISALAASGLPTDRFTYYGFVPKKEKKAKELFKKIKLLKESAIFYESPHRIKNTLKIMSEIAPTKQIVIAREITKKFEEFIRGEVKEVEDRLKNRKIKGELVIILN
ncbi:16S rRNA (cytidine(1402)-2'-O)-methyltransferase [Candidatus Woesearchaeota archaeon]|nr:16S rRNA (cytidine(1402)-2'-O)-methyltransferase [Candidatus Woesearchaeota archaeon]